MMTGFYLKSPVSLLLKNSSATFRACRVIEISQDGNGQALLPHSLSLLPHILQIKCNSWDQLWHCACTSGGTHLAMGYFCYISSTWKALGATLCDVMAAATAAAPDRRE